MSSIPVIRLQMCKECCPSGRASVMVLYSRGSAARYQRAGRHIIARLVEQKLTVLSYPVRVIHGPPANQPLLLLRERSEAREKNQRRDYTVNHQLSLHTQQWTDQIHTAQYHSNTYILENSADYFYHFEIVRVKLC